MASKITLKDKKIAAEDLFMRTDKTQKEIAAIVGVTEKTIGKWIKIGKWEDLKQAEVLTTSNLIKNLYQKAYELSLEDEVNADKLVKLANTIEKLSDRKVTVSTTINVFKDFINWVSERDLDMSKKINELQRKFVDFKINER
ncbi:hypothetical protein MAR621_03130 [Maribacter dokdonensis]|uniref:hypothetical protein n=1 Tax=Maribacter dokdonensis TaxID=320912 RepID=UPI001B17409E|nr:hypothetical protein [Maribacter dokdonensis]CAG2532936.1 hypothetical protein MAR621_03130 [Maribacter dokdonensis]